MPSPSHSQQASVSVRQFGREREPVVIIDNFSGDPARLLEAGRTAQYQEAGALYPGLRALADPAYLDRQRPIMMEAMRRVFGFRQGINCELSTYSLVTLSEGELQPLQRIPHYDDTSGSVIAVMHYLLGPETGGTAFYRHNRTGFEAITPEREAAYNAAQAQDAREYGTPEPRYHHGESAAYTMIGEVEAQVDRLILYRGRLLHSGVIPDAATLSSDPAKGRLTINMFLRGQ